MSIDEKLVRRLHRQAKGERWQASLTLFAQSLQSSAERAFSGRIPSSTEIEQYLGSLHLEDLALACACAAGNEEAWGHFVLEQRPLLYRAADALDPSGGARDLADSLYADLFGLGNRSGERQSLFRYFHGRSSLTTWLRAVLAQRHVDRLRANRLLEALPDEDSPAALKAPAQPPIEPDRRRYQGLIQKSFARAVASLAARDRLRLTCYYAQGLTLAQTGKLLGEHESTSSRQLAGTRWAIRESVERELRIEAGLTDTEIAECFVSVAEDAGPLSLGDLLGDASGRKESAQDRSS